MKVLVEIETAVQFTQENSLAFNSVYTADGREKNTVYSFLRYLNLIIRQND